MFELLGVFGRKVPAVDIKPVMQAEVPSYKAAEISACSAADCTSSPMLKESLSQY
ncbi:hypothetical protein GUITHDRAFT_155083 [Guillardia theta CCMP2712]|uniref:Uncharacterized protein n=1 Tax=Guillardia theta (strain CCMP2712) TaxID=905079 RepID=L1IL35_GUITC|nr:hypothetical protein GUITHDRAFT_155083 [Guillardia theta CCMP2712]EKX36968.1 hypothetical protein GUITHDRAFT_155083 [Guillardia theta CCMP2712]|eukprot:XP_005823948.1 hypothetical protein GUITHDRAFT_155083 [Guillardia theta CCMP2712]